MNSKIFKLLSYAFSLIELLTVVAIISIIAALTIPGYLHNIVQTKVNSMWSMADPAKLALESNYLKSGTVPGSVTVNSGSKEYTTPTSSFVKCVTIQSGVISVVADPSQFDSKTLWISWTPTVSSGTLSWACNYSSDAAAYMGQSAASCTVGTAAYSGDIGCT